MKKTPFTVYLISLGSLALVTQMLIDGMCARLFGKLCLLEPETTVLRLLPGPIFPHESSLGWPYVLLASAWIGAIAALWMRKQWSAVLCALLAGLSAAFSVAGWVLGAILIISALHPTTAEWLLDQDGN